MLPPFGGRKVKVKSKKKEHPMRIYLDNCCYNRPYDDLSQLSVNLEAQAKLHIQSWIRDGSFELVTSEMLMTEIDDIPSEVRKEGIISYVEENSSVHVGPENNHRVNEMAREIMRTGVKYKDACHVASAMIAKCEYFISTDKRLLKYKSEEITMLNPVSFVSEMEEQNDE